MVQGLTHPGPLLITCSKGLPVFLGRELRALGCPQGEELRAAVATRGSLEEAMRLNLWLRTANRVLLWIGEFHAEDGEDLYRQALEIPWETLLRTDRSFSVASSVDNPTIRDGRYANLKCKDAIADRMRTKCGRRPNSGPEREGAAVFLYWREATCQVYLDTSGETLSRRGYRKIPMQAPLQETIAAGVVQATGWAGSGHFVNPMCGSGTLAIEAALSALDRPPGLLRSHFAFMHLKGFDAARWQQLREEAKNAARKAFPGRIVATDIHPRAVEAARKNAATAGVAHLIDFAVCDFAATPLPPGGGVVVLNPEYGERLGRRQDLAETYQRIGGFLKKRCTGYTGYVLTGNLELAKSVGLQPRRRIPFFNGAIECRLYEYDLYEGSRRS
jgi:putative N6-adenine-specific DNA methylase